MAVVGAGPPGRVIAGLGSHITTRRTLPLVLETRPVTETRTTRPRAFIYGRVRAGGTLVFAHRTSQRIPLTALTTLTARVMHLVIAFADHEVEAFDEVWFDNEIIPLEADGSVTPGHALSNWAWVAKHLGADGQTADPDLLAAAPDTWTAADRLRGVAYLYVRLVLNASKFPNERPPNITAVIRGRKLFDPRTHATAYSANAALALRDYLYNRRFGLKARPLYAAGTVLVTQGSPTVTGAGTAFLANLLPGDQFDVAGDGVWTAIQSVDSDTQLTLVANYGGATGAGKSYAAATEFDEAGAAAAANICDQSVTLAAGGAENRHEANGRLSSRDTPENIVAAFRTAIAGDLIQTGGKWLVKPGAFETPALDLGDDDLFEPPGVTLRRRRTELFNRVRGVFVSPDHLWQQTDLPPLTDPAFVAEDAGEDIDTSVQFALTTSFAACQRIMRIMLRRNREQEGVSLAVKTAGLALRAGDTVRVSNTRMGWTNKIFRVEAVRLRFSGEGLGVALDGVSEASGAYDWAAEEQALDPLPTVTLPVPFTAIDRPDEEDEPENFDLKVSGLELDNGADGNSTEFTGSSAKFKWRDNALVESFELGAEPGGAGSGERDANFRDWEVTIKDTAGTVRRVENVLTPAYEYGIDRNRADGKGVPVRSFAIEVRSRTTDGQISRFPAKLSVGNPPPKLPVGALIGGGDRKIIIKDVILAHGAPDPDQQGLAVWSSTTQGFTPDATTLIYAGAIATVEATALADATIYARIAIFDAFGLDGLNISDELAVKTTFRDTLAGNVVTWDLAATQWGLIDLRDTTGNVTLTAINIRQGTFFLTVVADGTDTVTYDPAVFAFADGGASPDHASGASGQVDIVSFISDGTLLAGVAQQNFKAAS